MMAEQAKQLLARLTVDVLAWWRNLRAVGEAPTLAGLRAAPVPEVAFEGFFAVAARGDAGAGNP